MAEGAHTAPVLVELAARHGVAMPIVDAVGRLLGGRAGARGGRRAARPPAHRREGRRLDRRARRAKRRGGDLAALAKGGRTNFLGFLLRLAARLPFLFIAGRLYGAEALGRFASALVVVELIAMLCTMGEKRGLAQRLSERRRRPGPRWSPTACSLALARRQPRRARAVAGARADVPERRSTPSSTG